MTETRAAPSTEFTNVGITPWWRKGIFGTQTAYVTLALLVVIAAMALASPTFLTGNNLSNVAKNFSFIAIAALGITLVIITGGIDLSVGSVMAFSAMLCAMTMNVLSEGALAPYFVHAVNGKAASNVPGLITVISIAVGIGAAVIIGLINGLLIAELGLSPFVTTLGMLSIVRGLAYVVTNGRGSFPGGPDADIFYSITSGEILGIPAAFIILMVLAVLMGFVLHHTSWGRYVFAIGGNEKAAELTGVPVARIKIQVYVIGAVAAGLNGIIISGWLGSAPANLATSYELNVIAAAVIGGANLAGGIGGPTGAVIGCVLLEVIRNGLVLAGVNSYWQQTFVGLIIILAVLVDRFRTRIKA
jgi:ribose transport system permease protein